MLQEQQNSLKKKDTLDKETQEAIRIAQELDKAEEEEFMKKAIAESQALEEQQKTKQQQEEDEDMKMI